MTCRDCKFEKCLMRMEEEFEVCPVEVKKREMDKKESQ